MCPPASPADSIFKAVPDGVTVRIRLSPRAARDGIGGVRDDGNGGRDLSVRVSAPPADGRANAALMRLLAKAWRVPASSLSVVSGARDRRKAVLVAGDREDLLNRLSKWEANHRG